MTHSGDEPQLGGQPQDNAPMISSVQTRAIVSARGAYAAGNLQALVAAMNPAQQAQFHQAAVRHVLDLAQQLLASAGLAPSRVVNLVLELADRWFSSPTAEYGQELVEPLLAEGWIEDQYYLFEAYALSLPSLRPALQTLVDFMTNSPPQVAGLGMWNLDRRRQWVSQRWALDAAWQILHGRPAPPFDHAAAGGVQGEYRSGNLAHLIRRMTMRQRLRLRQALMRQLLHTIPRFAIRQKDLDRGWQEVLAAAYQWSEQLAPDDTALREAAGEVDRLIWKGKTVSDKLSRTSYQIYVALDAIVNATGWKPEATAASIETELGRMGWIRDRHQVRWWQVEAAWAILNGEDPPPLGDEP